MGFAIILAALLLFVWLRHRFLLRQLADMVEAIEARSTILDEGDHLLAGRTPLRALLRRVNQLIAESNDRSLDAEGRFAQIEATLSSIKEAVLLVDESHVIVFANRAFRRLFFDGQPIVGARLEGLLQDASFLEFVDRARILPENQTEIELTVKNDHRAFELTSSLLHPPNPDDSPLTLLVLHDITRQRRLERVRRDFVANVSHELRTPVTIIKGFTETLLDNSTVMTPDDRRRFLEKISKNTARLHSLLEDLLSLSTLESEAGELKREPRSLHALIRETAENFQMRLDPDSQRLVLDLAAEDDEVAIEGVSLTQVLENILDNAVRHARGASRLEIATEVEGGRIRCAINDDGAGIPARHLPYLFERFYRVDRGRSRELGGTGLGLSIVRHIVVLHDGEVFAESQVGEGSSIGFYLPLVSTEVADEAVAGRDEAAEAI